MYMFYKIPSTIVFAFMKGTTSNLKSQNIKSIEATSKKIILQTGQEVPIAPNIEMSTYLRDLITA